VHSVIAGNGVGLQGRTFQKCFKPRTS